MASDEGAIWADRHGIKLQFKPEGAHADLAERHNELLRQQFHKIRSQCHQEGLRVTNTDILDEAVLAKNMTTTVQGVYPVLSYAREAPAVAS